jgi:hypothetical protein
VKRVVSLLPAVLGLVAAGLGAAGCASEKVSMAPVMEGGQARYAASRAKSTIQCAGQPIVLSGDRNLLRLTGDCRDVTVAGRRNDVHVDIEPGGTIEITGARNDVTWRQTGPGPAPNLKPTGPNNAFHRDAAS